LVVEVDEGEGVEKQDRSLSVKLRVVKDLVEEVKVKNIVLESFAFSNLKLFEEGF